MLLKETHTAKNGSGVVLKMFTPILDRERIEGIVRSGRGTTRATMSVSKIWRSQPARIVVTAPGMPAFETTSPEKAVEVFLAAGG